MMNANRYCRHCKVVFWLIACALVLTGCGDRMSDLRQYAAQVKAKKGGYVEPLPQVKPFETFVYADENLRSPFNPQFKNLTKRNVASSSNSKIHPDFNRSHEYLEQFPLDSLKMAGTLKEGGTLWALIRDGDGIVHRVKTGNYMGQNYGKITSIDNSGLTLREIVPNGQGGWVLRMTTVQLGQ